MLGKGFVDVFQVAGLAAARRTVVDDLAFDLVFFQIYDRHFFTISQGFMCAKQNPGQGPAVPNCAPHRPDLRRRHDAEACRRPDPAWHFNP
jgi:hypothetical protein